MIYVNGKKYNSITTGDKETVRELNKGYLRVYRTNQTTNEKYQRARNRTQKGYSFISDRLYVSPSVEIRVNGIIVIPLETEVVNISKITLDVGGVPIVRSVLVIKMSSYILEPECNKNVMVDYIVTHKGGKFIV